MTHKFTFPDGLKTEIKKKILEKTWKMCLLKGLGLWEWRV